TASPEVCSMVAVLRPGLLIPLLIVGSCTSQPLIEQRDDFGRTQLMLAAEAGQWDAVRTWLDDGANVHAADKRGFTALMYAASSGYADIVQALFERGADPAAEDANWRTPLIVAAGHQGGRDTVEALLEAGADVNALE